MRKKRLGRSGLIVSEVGLGTMNFGSQLTEPAACAILDAAVDAGVTFIDTAEMYASPPGPETAGLSEEILGRWLSARGRDRVIVASKIVGPADGRYQTGQHIRSGRATLDAFHISRAIDQSLWRLRTDYIDLMQFHWPDRVVPWEEQLKAIDKAVSQGKVRYFGCSNESAWGLMRAVACSERYDLPRPVSVQNELSLVRPDAYAGLEEICLNERIGFIAYSPLAMGLLAGKYKSGALPSGSRLQLHERYRRNYLTQDNLAAVAACEHNAGRLGVSLVEYAYWWCLTRPAVAMRADQLL